VASTIRVKEKLASEPVLVSDTDGLAEPSRRRVEIEVDP
jgi:hypothetical protein